MRSKSILLDKVLQSKRNNSRQVIGVIGTHPGAGVTHTGLMLAFYFGEEFGKRTAYVECNGHHDMGRIQASYDWIVEKEHSFGHHNITCYREADPKLIPEIIGEDYEFIVIDFGTDLTSNREEFLRCNRKLTLTGQAEWQQNHLERFIGSVQAVRGNETWLHLIPFAKQKVVVTLSNTLDRKVYAVPFNPIPIIPNRKTCQLFDELFLVR